MTNYKKILNACSLFLMVIIVLLVSCKDDDDGGTQVNGVQLYSFGPSVLRGGQMVILGANLDQVDAVILPDNVEMLAAEFDAHTSTEIVLDVPDGVVEGTIKLMFGDGEEIVSKTALSILEPITITSIPTGAIRPGSIITIEGTYLNLIEEIVFATNKSVTEFESLTTTENLGGTALEVRVPEDAQSGVLLLKDGQEIPNVIKTVEELEITLPSMSSITPLTVKAGNTLTINGANLDLVTMMTFGGDRTVDSADFVSQTASIIEVSVPANAQDGVIQLTVASALKVSSSDAITLVMPTITSITPNPAKTDGEITVTGTNLLLVSEVVFAGNKVGTISAGGTETSLTLGVPTDALSGAIEFRTNANKNVMSAAVNMVNPTITSIPAESVLEADIVITGTHLDIVGGVRFLGNVMGTIVSATETSLTVTVPIGSLTGEVTVIANNGEEVTSTTVLTILAEVPIFAGFPASAQPGEMLTLTGTKLNLTKDVIFPGDIAATKFGSRTAILLEVYVPDNVDLGVGKITFTTYGTDFTESSDINFSGVEPVADPSLVFFDFDGKGSWWGGGVVTTDPANSTDGTNFVHITGDLSGWNDLFWRNGGDIHGKDVVGTNVANYEIWFDVKVNSPIEDGNLKMRLEGSEGDFWWTWGPAATPSGVGGVIPVSAGWYTMKVPVTSFAGNYGWDSNVNPTNASLITGAFGMAWDNGAETLDVYIDNVRWAYVGP